MRLIIAFLMAGASARGVRRNGPRRQTNHAGTGAGKAAKPAQPEAVEALQTALNALEERKGSLERAKQYQHVIDNFLSYPPPCAPS